MYAIIETGGKQYRIEPQSVVEVELLEGKVGEEVVLDKVLLVNQEGKVQTGRPYIEGAKVVCKLLAHDKGKKIDVFDYKSKKNIRRHIGHRQPFSRLQVESIAAGAVSKSKKEK
jgi:large subunit ribosomal protein L21